MEIRWNFFCSLVLLICSIALGDFEIPDDGWIGSESEPNVMRIAADGDITWSDGSKASNRWTFLTTGTSTTLTFSSLLMNFSNTIQGGAITDGAAVMVRGDLKIADDGLIGSLTTPDALQIDSSGNITMSQNLTLTDGFLSIGIDSAIVETATGGDVISIGTLFKPTAASQIYTMVGFTGGITDSSDNVSLLVGGVGSIIVKDYTGTVADLRIFSANATVLDVVGAPHPTITNYTGYYVLDPTVANAGPFNAEIVNLHGVFIEEQTMGTTNWQTYSVGGASYFGGTDGIYLGQTDGAEKISSPSDGTLGLFAGTTIEANTNLFKFGLGSAADVVTQWVTDGGTGTLHYDDFQQRWVFNNRIYSTSDIEAEGGIFAGADSDIDGDFIVYGNISLDTDGAAANLTLSFASAADTGTLTWDNSTSCFVLLNDIVFQGDVDIESGTLDVNGALGVTGISRLDGGIGIGADPLYDVHVKYSSNSGTATALPTIRVENTNVDGQSFAILEVVAENTAVRGQILADGEGTLNGGTPNVYIRTTTEVPLLIGTNSTKAITIDGSTQDVALAANLDIESGTIFHKGITQTFSGSKVLEDGVATGFVDIAIATGEFLGGNIIYSIYVSGSGDFQSHSGEVSFAAVNKAGTVESDIEEQYLPAAEAEIRTTGGLTDDFTITDGANKITINCDAATTLGSPTLTLKYTITMHNLNTITAL